MGAGAGGVGVGVGVGAGGVGVGVGVGAGGGVVEPGGCAVQVSCNEKLSVQLGPWVAVMFMVPVAPVAVTLPAML